MYCQSFFIGTSGNDAQRETAACRLKPRPNGMWRRATLKHLPVLAWAAYIELPTASVPLHPLENLLRRAAVESGYSSSVWEHLNTQKRWL
jgi:hypothetical protein